MMTELSGESLSEDRLCLKKRCLKRGGWELTSVEEQSPAVFVVDSAMGSVDLLISVSV